MIGGITLPQAIIIILHARGVNVEGVYADRRGLLGLLRCLETSAACIAAMETLRELLRSGKSGLTGKQAGRSNRRAITALEAQKYFIDIEANELSVPYGGYAPLYPTITELGISEEALMKWLWAPAKGAGASTVVDWSVVHKKFIRLMEYHGDITRSDLEWNNQAKIEKKLLEFCREKLEKEPGLSTLRGYLRTWLKEYRAGYQPHR